MKAGLSYSCCVLVLVFVESVVAMPANDRLSAASVLGGVSGQVSGTNVAATLETGEPDHSEPGGKSVWWRWTAAQSGVATFYTHGSNFDTLLAVYTGSVVSQLTQVAANDDAPNEIQSSVRVQVQGGTTYRIAVDGYQGAEGRVTLSWLFEPQGVVPANDRFVDRGRLSSLSGRLVTSNYAASNEPQEPRHAGGLANASMWWSWIAAEDGVFFVHTEGSNFDTTLAVYVGSDVGGLSIIASDDDSFPLQSALHFPVTAGTEYQIAVDGFDSATGIGVIVLDWAFTLPCSDPPVASQPFPPADSSQTETTATLEWNGPAALINEVIYGNDDRQDLFEVSDPDVVAAAQATVALVLVDDLQDNGNGTFSLPATTLAESMNVCPEEPFADQPTPAFCSGFLVAPDMVATAGHCLVSDADCLDVAFVFGFRMLSADQAVLTFAASDIYFCAGPVGRRFEETQDWALWRLDREVVNRTPLPVRRQGDPSIGQPLVMIGHPSGLPVKVAGGAAIREVSVDSFLANVDAYGGNSGSPVLNQDTLEVEGVLVSGEADFDNLDGCFVSRQCPDDGCVGERNIRTSLFSEFIPANPQLLNHQVFFGPCGALEPVGTTSEESWVVGDLEAGTTYCWQIVTHSECGTSAGPVWSFQVRERPRFVRGDTNVDGRTNIADAVNLLNYLFGGDNTAVSCDASGDANDDSTANLADSVYILRFLFDAGTPLPPPAADCGTDPTPDLLMCDSFPRCP